MSDKRFTLKKNAVRAARKLIADGKAPAPSFAIKTAASGGFQIVWDAPAAVEQPTQGEAEYGSVPAKGSVKTRGGRKQNLVIDMLKRPEGASDTEIKNATGWKIVRGFIAGTVKKKLGHNVISTKEAERGRVYRVVA